MNTKITFPELISAISIATNTSKRVSETFLKEFFTVITEALSRNESVKIKKIGTFKLVPVDARKSINVNTGEEIEIAAHNRLAFIPDKDLAEAINMPFSSFETIVLNDDITESIIDKLNDTSDVELNNPNTESAGESSENVNIDTAQEESIDAKNDTELVESENSEEINQEELAPFIEDIESKSLNKDENDSEPEIERTEEIIVITTDTEEEIDAVPEISTENNSSEYQHCGNYSVSEIKCSFGKGFFWGFICALFTATGIFFIIAQLNGFPIIVQSNDNDTIQSIEHEPISATPILIDSVTTPIVKNEIQSIAKEKIQLDTITKNRFLTTMARKYYGDYNFWVYIYEENSTILGDPNKIKPGTVVVIPPADKYGIDKTNKNSLKDARSKALVIFKKYE